MWGRGGPGGSSSKCGRQFRQSNLWRDVFFCDASLALSFLCLRVRSTTFVVVVMGWLCVVVGGEMDYRDVEFGSTVSGFVFQRRVTCVT